MDVRRLHRIALTDEPITPIDEFTAAPALLLSQQGYNLRVTVQKTVLTTPTPPEAGSRFSLCRT